MAILLMVKKSSKQVGYGRLQTIKDPMRGTENRDTYTQRLKELALKARDAWARINPNWVFRIVNEDDFGGRTDAKYPHQAYYDDVMVPRHA